MAQRRKRRRSQPAKGYPPEGNGALQLARERGERAERALLQYWRLLDAIFETIPDMFALKDRRGVYQAAGPAFCRFAGLEESAIRGRTDLALFPGALAAALRRHDHEVLRSMRSKTWEERIESGESWRVLRIAKTPVPGEDQRCAGILCAIRDVTELHRLLQQNNVLSRVASEPFWVLDMHGRILAASEGYCQLTGFARDTLTGKNIGSHPVTAGHVDIAALKRRLSRDIAAAIPTRHRAQDGRILQFLAHSTCVHGAGGRILQFFELAHDSKSVNAEARKRPERENATRAAGPRAKVISLNDIVRTALSQEGKRMPRGIRIACDLHSELRSIVADPLQILQVFSNLLSNAVEAIDSRGAIRITTRNVEVAEELAMLYPNLKPGHYAMLSIEDTGRGIEPELLAKIFDPFITTKESGNGMGLAMAQRNVRAHGGHITVRSQAGKGSTFCVFLPATEHRRESERRTGIPPVGTETVLLAEDEPHLLTAAQRMLEKLGYRVVAASGMHEAFELLRQYPEPIDAAVFDTALPELDDPNFVRRIKRLRPAIRILVSGSRELDAMTQDLLDAGAVTYVRTPFRIEEFAPKLRHALDRRE